MDLTTRSAVCVRGFSSLDRRDCAPLPSPSGSLVSCLISGGSEGVELLAQGDVLRPWVLLGPTSSVATAVSWSVLEPASVADLNADFARRVAPWPEITAALMDRLMLRSRWLAFALAVAHVRR